MQKNFNILQTPGERLKYLRGITGLSREYVQQKYQISIATLRMWENKTHPLSEKSINRCIRFLSAEGIITTKEWINAGIGHDLNITSFDIKNISSFTTENKIDPYDNDLLMIQDANNFKSAYQDAAIMMVSDNGMEPFYKLGDYVGGRLAHFESENIFLGKDCIVVLEDNNKLFRRVFKSLNESINLSCINPIISEPVIYNASIKMIFPVIWHRKFKP